MNTVKAWIDKWIKQFGTKKDDDDVMLILKSENDNTVYEGHFLEVPEKFYSFKVIENSRCLTSSDKHREGAYILKVNLETDVLNELINLMEHGSGDITMGASGCGKARNYADLLIAQKQRQKEEQSKNELSRAISNRITNLCDEYGYSINYLSKLSGITQSTVNDIVNCKSKNVGIATIKKLCEGLDITLEEFFTDPLFRKYD